MKCVLNVLKEIGKRTYNFFVGPTLYGGIVVPDWWHFSLGACLFWDSAPGWHFDKIGVEVELGPWFLFLHYVDNG